MPDAPEDETRVTLLKQRPLDLLRGVGLGGLRAGLMLLFSAVSTVEGKLALGLGFLILAGLSLFQGLRNTAEANATPTPIPTVIGVRDPHVVLGEDRFERTAIGSAYQLAGDPPRVRLRIRRRLVPLDLQLKDQEEVDALLDDLGFAASQRAIAFRAEPFAGQWLTTTALFAAIGAAGAAGVAFGGPKDFGIIAILWGGIVLALLTLLRQNSKVLVGTDGIFAKRGPFRRRFVPFARVGASSLTPPGEPADVVIEVESEPELRIRFTSHAEAEAFVARLRSAPRGDASPHATVAAALSRGDMAPQAWVHRLKALTDLGSSRRAAVTLDRLFAILESPDEEPAQRAAAAVAVSGRADEPAVRLRIDAVAEASAQAELRQVLDAIREDCDDDALAEALVTVERLR